MYEALLFVLWCIVEQINIFNKGILDSGEENKALSIMMVT